MGKIDDLPTLDKPREKAARFGIETLSDEELLALIITMLEQLDIPPLILLEMY